MDDLNKEADLRRRSSVLMIGSWNVRNLGKAALETDRVGDRDNLDYSEVRSTTLPSKPTGYVEITNLQRYL